MWSCEVCQRTKADLVGRSALLNPLPLPSRLGGVIGVDWLLGLPMTASGFDQVQVHVDHLCGKIHAVPTRATDTSADASRDGPLFRRRIGSSLLRALPLQTGRSRQWWEGWREGREGVRE